MLGSAAASLPMPSGFSAEDASFWGGLSLEEKQAVTELFKTPGLPTNKVIQLLKDATGRKAVLEFLSSAVKKDEDRAVLFDFLKTASSATINKVMELLNKRGVTSKNILNFMNKINNCNERSQEINRQLEELLKKPDLSNLDLEIIAVLKKDSDELRASVEDIEGMNIDEGVRRSAMEDLAIGRKLSPEKFEALDRKIDASHEAGTISDEGYLKAKQDMAGIVQDTKAIFNSMSRMGISTPQNYANILDSLSTKINDSISLSSAPAETATMILDIISEEGLNSLPATIIKEMITRKPVLSFKW